MSLLAAFGRELRGADTIWARHVLVIRVQDVLFRGFRVSCDGVRSEHADGVEITEILVVIEAITDDELIRHGKSNEIRLETARFGRALLDERDASNTLGTEILQMPVVTKLDLGRRNK